MIIHYEVYVLESRGWMLHARHTRAEREASLGEAKELERIGLRTKVVRETYYPETNKFDEAEIYISPRAAQEQAAQQQKSAQNARPQQQTPPRPRPGATPSRAAPSPSARSGAPRKQAEPPRTRPRDSGAPSAGNIVARLLAIVAAGLAMALLAIRVTPEIILILWDWGIRPDLARSSYEKLLFAIFVLVFLMVSVPLGLKFLPNQAPVRRYVPQPVPQARPTPVRRSVDTFAATAAYDTAPEETFEEREDAPQEVKLPDDDLPEIRPGDDEALPDIRGDDVPPPKPKAEEPKPPAGPPASSATAEASRGVAMRFLNGAVAAVKAANAPLDAYNKFALHLYLAGGVETMCSERRLGEGERKQLTVQALETLGTSGDLARRFLDKMEEYLMEPRYMQVLQAGRNAMSDFLAGDEGRSHDTLKSQIKEWNKPTAQKAAGPAIVTVMFTDMVGSTDMTQARGDAAAQEVVRRHNAIVRSALAQFGGREIKHTGDGIMASFGSAAGAVDSAVAIQRQVADHNAKMPNLEMHLRIGLNAGEPIQEEDDLFGATVQLAARVCAATNTDQILCSGVVKDLAASKGGTFRAMGAKALKGFKDPIPLFEIAWR